MLVAIRGQGDPRFSVTFASNRTSVLCTDEVDSKKIQKKQQG